MKNYFIEKWKGTDFNKEKVSNDGESEVMEDVFEDYFEIGSFLTKNELNNRGNNVRMDGVIGGLFNA